MKHTPILSRTRTACLWLLTATVLGGCSSIDKVSNSVVTLGGLITPYKIDILQGNVVTREQVQALQPGMVREQVRNILGTPLLESLFHGDRWDYVFTFNRQGQEPQQRRVTVFFKGDVLERVEAEELPTEAEFVASLATKPVPAKAPVLEASEAELKAFAEKNNARPVPSTPATQAPVPATHYPPLEAR